MKSDYVIGIDIGGTKMAAILFDGKNIIADYVLATPKDSLDHFMVMLLALIEPLEERAKNDKKKISGIGLGVAGVIDYMTGKMLSSPNIPIIDGINLAKKLAEKTEINVVIDNDANCFVRAEAELGIARGKKSVYGIIVGTGIGGGWYIDGDVYRGAHGGAGEPGEMVIDYKTGEKLESAYHKITKEDPASMAKEAYLGDSASQEVFDELGAFLGVAFANIVNVIDPEMIVLGGGVVESSDLFLSQIKKTMRENIFSNEAKKIKVVKSKIGNYAGAIGAALLVK